MGSLPRKSGKVGTQRSQKVFLHPGVVRITIVDTYFSYSGPYAVVIGYDIKNVNRSEFLNLSTIDI